MIAANCVPGTRLKLTETRQPMFAIVRTGGKQYRVAAGDKIAVEKLPGEAGDTVSLDDVLLAGDGGEIKDSMGLVVSAEIIAQERGEKVIVWGKGIGILSDPDAGGDAALSRAVVELGGDQIGRHAPLAVIMRGLQQRGGFARVHRGVIEV